jgi:ferric iron reductase protein FhuF
VTIDSTACHRALLAAAEVGEFFDLLRPLPDGRPLALLVSSPSAHEARVAGTGRALAGRVGVPPEDLPRRAVASLLFLGVTARLVAPPFAAIVLAGVAPEITLETAMGGELADGRYVLTLTTFAALDDDLEESLDGSLDESLDGLGDRLGRQLLVGQISRLVTTFAGREALHPRLLWGNVASVVASTGRLVANHDPTRTDAARRLTQVLLAHPLLSECGEYRTMGDPAVISYRRRSCCLYYQLPGAGLCGDCPLRPKRARLTGDGEDALHPEIGELE